MNQQTLDSLREAGSSTLASQLFSRGIVDVVLQGPAPMSRGRSFAGPARTLRYVPARQDTSTLERLPDPAYPQRALIEELAPGDVVVVDARGVLGTGVLGEIILARVAARGAAAVITDGSFRDVGGIAGMELPVYGCGPSPGLHLALHEAAGRDVVIGCGGVQVRPGDIMVGDDDGVVCIPLKLAAEVAAAGAEQTRLERFVLARIQAGATLPGTYPPSDAVRAEYEQAKERGEA